ncbi:hypothetical protein HK100_009943 [Physocladia obscura]|uniref:Uncharacterized protein n=1 Tax=Physocladia obscura TaxID=109957 RepID=A0AAD5TBP1_9FUNG|nr:hypothetical protein HK100_009943 [Physocladia obscura]
MTHANIASEFAQNFLRCPSDNPVVIFENSNFEQAFIRVLLTHSPLAIAITNRTEYKSKMFFDTL